MNQAEQLDGQVMDLENMTFKSDDLKQFTSHGQKDPSMFAEVKINKK